MHISSYIAMQIYELITTTVLSSYVATMKPATVCLCWRLPSIIFWFTDLCFYWTCWRGLEGFASPSPLAIFHPVILKGNCAASYKITLTGAVKWQGKGGQSTHLNIFFRRCSEKLPVCFLVF